MNWQRGKRAVVLPVAAIALLSLAACGDAEAPLLPRDTVDEKALQALIRAAVALNTSATATARPVCSPKRPRNA